MVDRVDQLEGRQPLLEATRVIDEERLHSVHHPSTTRYFVLRDTLCYERLCATRAFVLQETMCYTSSCVIRVHMSLRDHVSSRDHVSLRDVSLRYLSFYSVRNVDISRSLCLSHLVSSSTSISPMCLLLPQSILVPTMIDILTIIIKPSSVSCTRGIHRPEAHAVRSLCLQ